MRFCSVSVGDIDLVKEVVAGLESPRLEEVWVTGKLPRPKSIKARAARFQGTIFTSQD